jgi:elongation factor 1-alpha
VKQIIVGVNKMDCSTANYSEERFNEVRDEMRSMLTKVGWKKNFVKNSVPIIPMSGFKGDNLIKKSDNMSWWKGVDVDVERDGKKEKVHIETLLDGLDKMVNVPKRKPDAAMRMPLSGVLNIKGVGDVVTGRVEQGSVEVGKEVKFLPTHCASNPCTAKVFTTEMHRKSIPAGLPGMNIGCNVKGLPKTLKPKSGDIMVYADDSSLGVCKSFTAQVKVITHPGELKKGYCPIAYVRTGKSPVRLSEIKWHMGKKTTGGKKVENPVCLKADDVAEVVFEPTGPFVVDTFKSCEGLGRVAIMEGNSVVMLGKVIAVEFKE